MGVEAESGRWTLVVVCATTFMLLVDITIVNVALPSVQRQLHASLTGLQWVVDAYAVSLAALILTAGSLADRYGRKRVFAVGIVLFTGSSFLCGIAWNVATLDIARALQGVGGAALFATALALIGAEYQGPARMNAIAIWGSTVGFAVAAGPLLRRDHHGLAQLALDLLRQHPDRRVRLRVRRAQGPRVARPRGTQHRRRWA